MSNPTSIFPCSLPQSLKQPVEFDQAINYVNKIKVRVFSELPGQWVVVGLAWGCFTLTCPISC